MFGTVFFQIIGGPRACFGTVDGVVVFGVDPDGVAVVAHGDGGGVVDLHDGVAGVVDVRELVLAGGAGGDEEDVAAGQVVRWRRAVSAGMEGSGGGGARTVVVEVPVVEEGVADVLFHLGVLGLDERGGEGGSGAVYESVSDHSG